MTGWGARFGVMLCIGGLWLGPDSASADTVSAHATGSGSLAVTDNLFSAPNSGEPGREADVYVQVRPGFLLSYEAHRIIQELSGEIEGTGYATHPDAWGLTGQGNWRGYYVLSEFADLMTTASASKGRSYAVMPRSASLPPQLTPGGQMDFWQADAGENLQWTLTSRLSLVQQGFVRKAVTSSTAPTNSDAFEAGGELGLAFRWQRDSVVLQGGAMWADLFRQTPDGILEDNTYLHLRGVVSWRHDFNRRWGSALDVGVTQILRMSAPGQFLVPTGTLQLFYEPAWGEAVFVARHAVEPNLFLAETTLVDAVSATAILPIPGFVQNLEEPTYTFEASAGLSRTRILDARTDEPLSAINLLALDAAANYQPDRAYSVGVRLMVRIQTGNEVAGVPGYIRNTLLVTGTWRWPERIAGRMPRRRNRLQSQDLEPIERDVSGGRGNR